MHLKKAIGRQVVKHPARITSAMIRDELLRLKVLGPDATPAAVSKFLKADDSLGDLYKLHPVTLQALSEGYQTQAIVPLSVFFDGVVCSKNESFLGFYVTNLRTGQQRLAWLLRIFYTHEAASFVLYTYKPRATRTSKKVICVCDA